MEVWIDGTVVALGQPPFCLREVRLRPRELLWSGGMAKKVQLGIQEWGLGADGMRER
jgi:hypothetical protein